MANLSYGSGLLRRGRRGGGQRYFVRNTDFSTFRQMQVRDYIIGDLIRKAYPTFRQAAFAPGCMENGTSMLCSKRSFPSTWSAESSIQLATPKQSDTSDRSLFERARLATFDRDGYERSRGLRRPLYYKSGFITCTKCNGLTLIDASALRSILELKHHVDFEGIRHESLPPCAECGETSGLRVGAHDFLSPIEGGKEALAARRRVERIGAIAIQRAFRGYLNIQWRLAEATRQRTIFLLRYRSAQAIQAMLRGRLSRRVFETETYLLVISKANRFLVQHALRRYPDRKRVFWYKNSAEEEQLYSDYRLLVQRTGFRPPRMVVEQNIREIDSRHQPDRSRHMKPPDAGRGRTCGIHACRAKKKLVTFPPISTESGNPNGSPGRSAQRILERKTELASRIQARWRGIIARRYLIVFRTEVRRQRQVRASMALRIQRATRGWSHRRFARRWRSQRAAREATEHYHYESEAKAKEDAHRNGSRRLFLAYVRERQEELTARLMGHTEPKMTGGLKMKAFYESPYGNDAVASMMNHEIREILRRENEAREKDLARKQRAERVRLKVLEDPQMATYFREEMTARNVYVINKLRLNQRAPKKVSNILRHHNQTGGRKYSFPLNINRDPMAVLYERNATDAQTILRQYSRAGEQRKTSQRAGRGRKI